MSQRSFSRIGHKRSSGEARGISWMKLYANAVNGQKSGQNEGVITSR